METYRWSGSSLTSFRRPLIVLATGTFAIGTDAFVIGGVLPGVARSPGSRQARLVLLGFNSSAIYAGAAIGGVV
jgi:hypothetical protein